MALCRYPLALGDIGMMTSLVTFFLVFYNGNCFSRYQGKKASPCTRPRAPHNFIRP
jgi:hypothetical protein